MAEDLKRSSEMCTHDLLVLRENDGLFVKYSDGTSLELSPCGSAFLHREAAPSNSTMRQFTRFALSSVRPKIIEALGFRNLFAARPYLCKELTDVQELKVGYQEVTECKWPDHITTGFISKLQDGSTRVTSVDGMASLTLMLHRQTFVARFLAEVKYKPPQKTRNSEADVQKQKRYFTWQEQIHSLFSYPEAWKNPLQLALDAANGKKTLGTCHNMTTLPASLPVTCSAVHLHKWKSQVPEDCDHVEWGFFGQSDMKVIWKDRATYKIFRQPTGLFTIEIDPGDGSVMRSQTPRGRYFDHWFVQQNGFKDLEIQERVYSADKPLPDRLQHRFEYSIGRLVKQAARWDLSKMNTFKPLVSSRPPEIARYIEYLSNAGQPLEERCCWKEGQALKTTTPLDAWFHEAHIIDTADVPGMGRFKAYSNGHISAVFIDRTILDIRNSTDRDKEMSLEDCWCQLILPNGRVVQFRLTDAEQCRTYERYLQIALHWAAWVKATPSQRQTFYKDSIWDAEKRGAVTAEVEKIKRFNYIHNQHTTNLLQSSLIKDNEKSANKEDFEGGNIDFANIPNLLDRETMIKNVLEQTNKAIDDIDNLLATSKCSSQNIPLR